MECRGLAGTVPGARLGQGLFLDQCGRACGGAPRYHAGPRDRPARGRAGTVRARPAHAGGGALLGHPRASAQAPARCLCAGDRRERVSQQVCGGVPDQGEPAAPGRRRGLSLRQGIRLRPGSGLQAGTAGGDGDDRGLSGPPHRLQRLQGFELHRSGDPRDQARAHHHSGGRELRRAGADPEPCRPPTACGRRSACA